jgi:N-acetylmuramoyl-L-alanine amidase
MDFFRKGFGYFPDISWRSVYCTLSINLTALSNNTRITTQHTKERLITPMNKRLIAFTILLVAALFAGMQMKHTGNPQASKDVFSKQTIRYGSSGDDVYELQGRLKFLGYYNGNIDGSFGYQTLRGVKDFQYKFGMKVDGIAGPKTKLKLWEATKSWAPTEPRKTAGGGSGGSGGTGGGTSSPGTVTETATGGATPLTPSNNGGMSENDIRIMANAVYGEARGEPYEGQVAVAAVILNRVHSPSFPNTASGVIFQPGAFTAVADGQIWLTPNESAKKAVKDALSGMDPSGGCIYYFNPETATSKWIWTRPQVKRIGKHIFCK